jgi:hypothetical protein
MAACSIGRACEIPMLDARRRAMCMQILVEDVWKQGRDVSVLTAMDLECGASALGIRPGVTSLCRSVRTDGKDSDSRQGPHQKARYDAIGIFSFR